MSRVLKPADDGTYVAGARVLDLRPVEERVRQIVATAERTLAEEAAATRRAARDEGFQAGRREGLKQGRQEGLEQGLQRAAELLATLTNALDEFDRRRARLITDAEQHLVSLALAIAERVIHAEVRRDPAAIARTAQAALELVTAADRVRIALAPEDVEELKAALPDLAARGGSNAPSAEKGTDRGRGTGGQRASAHQDARFGRGRFSAKPRTLVRGPFFDSATVELIADETITRGGCVIRTAGGEIDARIKTQLDEIERQLNSGR